MEKKKLSIQERRQADKLRRQRQRSRNPEGLPFDKWLEWKRAQYKQKQKKKIGEKGEKIKEKCSSRPKKDKGGSKVGLTKEMVRNFTPAKQYQMERYILEKAAKTPGGFVQLMEEIGAVNREMKREDERKKENEEIIASLTQDDKVEFLSLVEEEFPKFFWSAYEAFRSFQGHRDFSDKEKIENMTDFIVNQHEHNQEVPEMLRQWRSGKTVNKCEEESVSDSDGSIEEEEKPEEFWKRLGNTCEEEFPKNFLPSWLKRMANEEPENFLELVANFDKEELESGEKGTPMPDWQRSLLENDPRKFLKLCQEEENSDGGGDSVNYSKVASDDTSNGTSSENSGEDQDISDQSPENDEEVEVTEGYEDEHFSDDVPSPSLSPPLARYSPPDFEEEDRYSPPHFEEEPGCEPPIYEAARYSPPHNAGCSSSYSPPRCYSPPDSYSDESPASFSDDYSDYSD